MGFADQGSSALRNNRRLSKIGERKFHNKKFVLMGNDQPEKKAVDPVRSAEKIRAIRFWAKVQNGNAIRLAQYESETDVR